MKKQLTLYIMSFIISLSSCISATAKSSMTVQDSVRALPPYIIAIDEDDAVPVISDDYILRNGIPVRFKVNSSRVSLADKGYQQLRQAIRKVPKRFKFCRLLILRGSASPDGPVENNKWLAHRRARALADSLSRYITLPDSAMEERYINEDYDGLYNLVAASNFRYKNQVLSEIDNTDNTEDIKKRLKAIDHGRAWHLLALNFFPKLRATRVVLIVSPIPHPEPAIPNPEPQIPQVDTITEIPQADTTTITDVVAPGRDTVTSSPLPAEEPEEIFKPWIAIKSNMLYDAAITPNIEIERWFGKNHRWSVMAEWNFPWWQWHHKERVYEINEFGLELRRWLTKDRPWLVGHFIGIYAAGGYYDLEWRYHGEQGDIYSAGLTYGYGLHLSKHWNIEFSASVGYLYSPYTHYEAEHRDDILFAKYKKNFNYFGPTKLKVSIVWLLGKTKKR